MALSQVKDWAGIQSDLEESLRNQEKYGGKFSSFTDLFSIRLSTLRAHFPSLMGATSNSILKCSKISKCVYHNVTHYKLVSQGSLKKKQACKQIQTNFPNIPKKECFQFKVTYFVYSHKIFICYNLFVAVFLTSSVSYHNSY